MNQGKIGAISFVECTNSLYVKPKRVLYTQGGRQKSWDIIEAHDSVSILLFHAQQEAFLLVKQFRPAVYLKNGDGFTYELCAGIIDKESKTLQEIASEEIFEECGYAVSPDELQKITSFYTSVGFAGSRQTLFFGSIDETRKEHSGGGIDQEEIELVFLPLCEAKAFMMDENIPKTPGLLFAFHWFFERTASQS